MNLFNDDCLEVMRSMPYNSVDAIVTDPPYGILKHRIEQPIDITAFFQESLRILKPNSFIVYFGQQPTLTDWNSIAFKYFKYKTEIIWYKRQRTSPVGDIGRVYENIMICVKGSRQVNQVYRPYSDIKESLAEFTEWNTFKTIISTIDRLLRDKIFFDNAVEYAIEGKTSGFFCLPDRRNALASISNIIRKAPRDLGCVKTLINGGLPQNLVSFVGHNRVGYSSEGTGEFNIKHPTVKPIQLMEYLIDLTSKQGDVILDSFMGSGTTGIACKNLERDFIGVELDPEYFQIAQQRIEATAPVAQNPIVAQPIQPAAKVEENQLRLSL